VPEPAKKRITKKQRVRGFVATRGWQSSGEAEWLEMRAALPDVSESTLRECGIPIDAPWCGVSTHSFDELERCLRELSRIYADRPDLHRYCRDQVIAAKERARWASKSLNIAEDKRAVKNEMVEWMLVWLDDPSFFPAWIGLRRERMG
jgi:hypothetical protein